MSTVREFNKFISNKRQRKSQFKRKRKIDEFYSDRSRIIYSSSFRRLQQKAQVFSLEPNASVRTRLTHSLEVSDLGRTLANRIAFALYNKRMLTKENILSLVAIVENACLLHDIGNPPFGHFGESAIKEWAKSITEYASCANVEGEGLEHLIKDFIEFDGNPQGFRIVTKLHTEFDKFGLNLTDSTLLCILKYPQIAGVDEGSRSFKKAGYFQTEKEEVELLYKKMGLELNRRYPFVYIMEAADDIAYCMSDIADGIEKGIITEEVFLREFKKEWNKIHGNTEIPVEIPENQFNGFKMDISIPWSMKAMDEAVTVFFEKIDNIYRGDVLSLISESNNMGKVLGVMKIVSRRILYTSFEAESIERTGYEVITGILNTYSRLLKMKYEDFEKLINGESVKDFDYEKRLIHFIGKRYIIAYINAKDNQIQAADFSTKELWLRTHLIIDHVSGMTDEYALETFQMLKGIQLMR